MKCKNCGHSHDEHATDETHKSIEPCWAGCVTGDSCECKEYEPKEAK